MEPMPGEFDLVCANLPYVGEGAELPPEVTAQPAGALFAAGDGSAVVMRLLEAAAQRLRKEGRVLIEIDPAILEATVSATEKSYAGHKVHRDLGGHARVVEAWS